MALGNKVGRPQGGRKSYLITKILLRLYELGHIKYEDAEQEARILKRYRNDQLQRHLSNLRNPDYQGTILRPASYRGE